MCRGCRQAENQRARRCRNTSACPGSASQG
ncbi:hypothetical protein LG198_00970 [Methylobacillus arboreus]|nr:hypothetical protein [Methylobacillus arboreus]